MKSREYVPFKPAFVAVWSPYFFQYQDKIVKTFIDGLELLLPVRYY